MAYKLMNLSNFIQTLQKKQICSLDTEGAPSNVSQASLVNGEECAVINTYITNGKLPGCVGSMLNAVLQQNKLLVGFSVKGDIKALAKLGYEVSPDSVVVDLYLTFMNMLENKKIKKPPAKHDLSSVAKAHGICKVCGYHNSLVDASITMRLFWEMAKRTNGKFVVVQGNVDEELINEISEVDLPVPDSLDEKEQSVDVCMNDNGKQEADLQDDETSGLDDTMEGIELTMNLKYEEQKDESVYQVSKHLYEAIIETQGQKELVRLTDKEFKLYNRICRQTPNYPLWMFYQTIVAPGAFSRKESSLEKKPTKKHDDVLVNKDACEGEGAMGPLV